MADQTVSIKFVSDTSQLDKAIRAAKAFETRVDRLQKSLKRGQIQDSQYKRSLSALVKEFGLATRGGDAAAASALRYSDANWKAKYSVENLSSAVSSNTQRMTKQAEALARGNRAVNQYGDVSKIAGKRTNVLGMRMQQAGYQVGDFAVQVQSGTSAMVALGQQGAQFLGIFGAGGAIAGAGLAIATALINPLLKARDAAQSLNNEFDEYIKKLQESTLLAQSGGEGAVLAQKIYNEALEEQAKALAQLQDAEEELATLREQAAGANEFAVNLEASEQERRIREAKEAYDLAVKEAQVKKFQVDYLQDALEITQKLNNSEVLEAQNIEAARVQQRDAALEREAEAERAEQKRRDLEHQNFLVRQQETTEYWQNYIEQMNAAMAAEEAQIKALGSLRLFDLANQYASYGAGRAAMQDRVNSGYTLPKAKTSGSSSTGSPRFVEMEFKELNETLQRTQDLYSSVELSAEDAFVSMVDGTKTVAGAFKDMAADIVRELYRVLVVQRMVSQISGIISPGIQIPQGLMAGVQSAIGTRASGGSVMNNKPYLVGEQGPELFVPGSKGNIVNATQTANAMGGETINITQVYNVNGNGDEYIMGAIKAAAPSITNDAVKAVQRERRRGGTMKQAFG
ncbi:MAG: phage tail tape measure protein [Pseudomonadales bacterium]|nr:phage tail tape measure protein [Pseudomonadales bacterium]